MEIQPRASIHARENPEGASPRSASHPSEERNTLQISETPYILASTLSRQPGVAPVVAIHERLKQSHPLLAFPPTYAVPSRAPAIADGPIRIRGGHSCAAAWRAT